MKFFQSGVQLSKCEIVFAKIGHKVGIEFFIGHEFAAEPVLAAAGDDAHARGGADGGGDIGASEAKAFSGETVDIGGVDGSIAVRRQVTIAEVVGDDQDDVGGWGGVSSHWYFAG